MKEVKPNSPAAVKFLRAMFPNGPWLLVSIDPEDRARMDVGTFGPKSLGECEAFLKRHNGVHNIYFHVNPVMRRMNKKARREDIKEVVQFHVDVDPRPGQDIEEEQRRALKLLTEDRPASIPEPTFIVFSGGGYQAFWKLKQPIPINGDLAAAEDAKRYNQQLESVFKADHCHNIDRLMRLPGTVNVPDLKKRQKGRVPALATVVLENLKNTYPTGKFTQAKEVAAGGSGLAGAAGGVEVNVESGNIERISIEELKATYGVPDYVLEIIVQGESPREEIIAKKAEAGKDISRSAWLFEACCGMVRADVPDQVIYSVITDPTLGIADSVLMLKSGKKTSPSQAHNYAVRQIERAKEFAIAPELVEMNAKHAVIGNAGGKCQVIEEQWDEVMKREWLTFQSFGDIKNRYSNKRVQVGTDKAGEPIFMKLGDWWLSQQNRRQYDRITFNPDPRNKVDNAYNLWRGWAYEAEPGEKHETYLAHVRDNICSGDETLYNYLIRWMARSVQFPATNGQVAVVLRGERGTGKSQFSYHFGKLFGRHYITTSQSQHLVGNFNAHLRDCLLMFADEAFFAGDKKHESTLKTIVTEPHMIFEKKGHDAVSGPNFIRLIMASNSDWVVPAGPHERRFFVLDVSDAQRQNNDYFKKIDDDMNAGGYESLMHFLSSLDLDGFVVQNFPRTQALRDQQANSLSVEEQWWLSKLEAGAVLDADQGWAAESFHKAVYFNYVRFAQAARGSGIRVMTEISFGKWLRGLVRGLDSVQTNTPASFAPLHGTDPVEVGRPSVWVWPPLSEVRKAWESRYGERGWSVKQRESDPRNEAPF